MDSHVTPIDISEMGAKLAVLLRDVKQEGKEFAIMDQGMQVARLTPALQTEKTDIDAAIKEMREMRKQFTLGGLSWKDLRDEGRKW